MPRKPPPEKEGSGVQHQENAQALPASDTTGGESSNVSKLRGGKKKVANANLKEGNTLVAPDNTKWVVGSPGSTKSGRRAQKNVFTDKAGPSAYAKRNVDAEEVASAWDLLVDNATLKHIQKCTEAEARRQTGDKEWSLPMEELRAFIGILYARGACGAKGLKTHSLWSDKWGVPFCKSTMSRDRFHVILRYLRFDEKPTRSVRLATDKFALMSKVWNKFIENCQMCLTPGPLLCIDEQLFPMKTRCRFIQFMPNKPDKYGVKFWMIVDVERRFLVNAFPYLGKDDQRPSNERLSDSVVMNLTKPFLGKGRNVTCDNYFTSVNLCKELTKKNTTLVGTVNRARREIPAEVKNLRDTLYTSRVLKADDGTTLTTYQGKEKKNVLVLSSMHDEVAITGGDKKKPETIIFYNETKFGVDVVDQMCRKYSTKASSRRWPVQIFYNLLDLAGINAYALYKETIQSKISRRDFLLKLAEELSLPYQNARINSIPPQAAVPVVKRKHCQVLKNCNKFKGTVSCVKCGKVTCKKCIAFEEREVTCAACANATT